MASFTSLRASRSLFQASGLGQTSASAMLRTRFVNASRPGPVAAAAFHATREQKILPPLPQSIKGTGSGVNDPVSVPTPSPSHGSYHWTSERLVVAALVPTTMVPFVAGSVHPALDAALGALIVVHSHIGFQSCITDYFPKNRVPKTNRFMAWLLNGATAVLLYGFYELETSDVGLTEGVRRIWNA